MAIFRWPAAKLTLLSTVFAAIAGCANQAAPNFYNGRYYMAGDANCVKFRAISDSRVMCYDSSDNQMGYRDAMTAQDLYLHQMQVANQQAQMQQMGQALSQMGQSFNQGGQQALQQSQQYSTPQYLAPQFGPTNQSINCVQAGINTHCRY